MFKNAVDAEFRLWSFATFSTHTSNQEVYLRLKGDVDEIKFHWTIQTLTEFFNDDPGKKNMAYSIIYQNKIRNRP